MFEKGMAMHSGIDFDVSKSYMEVLRDKYHYEEFKSYNSQKGKKLDYETERGDYAPLLQMKIKQFMICCKASIEEKMIL